MINATSQFCDAIRVAGLTPPETIEADGKLRRFASNGKRGDDAGWYLLHGDGIPAGSFGDWRTGIAETWRADIGRTLTPAEEAAHRARVETMRREREVEQARRRAESMAKANMIWSTATPAYDDHPYLAHKRIKAHGAKLHRGALVIPMRADGVLHSLQLIGADGGKRFLSGGRVAGCYFSIGNTQGAATLCIAEGFATGATIHEATGYPVAVAFNAGNLLSVAKAMREKFPDLSLILCADDDCATLGNPGLAKATEAAQSIGGKLATPNFGADRPDGATDFNDMAAICSAEAVESAIASAVVPGKSMSQLVEESSTAQVLEGQGWPDPLPVPSMLLPVESFDVSLLPHAIRPWVVDIAERMQCPSDFPAVGAMVALSSVIGRKACIAPKRNDDWRVIPNLWGAVVGRPGVMKSPALSEVMRPLDRMAVTAGVEYDKAQAASRVAEKLAALADKADESKAAKLVKQGKTAEAERVLTEAAEADSAPPPALRRYKVTDASVEALGEILMENPFGTLAYRDELNGLLRSLDKEGQEGARAFYLQGYDGNQGYTFDRIMRGRNRRIPAVCIAMLGGIQPGKLEAYIRDAVSGSAGDDGLLQRFGLLVWPDVASEWRNVDRFPDTPAKAEAFGVFQRLDALEPATDTETGEACPAVYRFAPDAQSTFEDWRAEFEPRIRGDEYHPAMQSHLAKYRKLVPAVALVCALVDDESEVSHASLLRALAWAEYLQSHAERAYAAGTAPATEGAAALLAKIRGGKLEDGFSLRTLYLKGWTHLGTPEAARAAALVLCDLGHLRLIVEPAGLNGGRPSETFTVNPKTMTGV